MSKIFIKVTSKKNMSLDVDFCKLIHIGFIDQEAQGSYLRSLRFYGENMFGLALSLALLLLLFVLLTLQLDKLSTTVHRASYKVQIFVLLFTSSFYFFFV